MIPLCKAEGVGIIPWSPLARGYLAGARSSFEDRSSTKRAEHDSYGHSMYRGPGDTDIIAAVESIAEQRGVSPAEVSLAWLWAKGVTAPIIGATKLDHLDAAVRAVELELDDAEIEQLEAPYQPHEIMGH